MRDFRIVSSGILISFSSPLALASPIPAAIINAL
jgi:hypothetical protein